jgi:foldase protein PrsA
MLKINIKYILRKKHLFIVLILATLSSLYYVYYHKKTYTEEDVVAFVNGEPLFLKDLEERLSLVKINYPPDSDINFSEIKQTIINRMIVEELALQDAKRLDLKISKQELNMSAKNIKQGHSEEEFEQILMSEFIDNDDWLDKLKRNLLIEKLFSKMIIEKINVSESEIRNRYENYYKGKKNEPKVKIAQIFTKSKTKAEEALTDLKNNLPFEMVVKKHSESPEAKNDGIVGLYAKNEGPEVFDIAFDIEAGERSDILQSPYGYHIIKVLEHIPASELSYQQMRSDIISEIVREKETAHYEKWLEGKFKNSKILKNLKVLDTVK